METKWTSWTLMQWKHYVAYEARRMWIIWTNARLHACLILINGANLCLSCYHQIEGAAVHRVQLQTLHIKRQNVRGQNYSGMISLRYWIWDFLYTKRKPNVKTRFSTIWTLEATFYWIRPSWSSIVTGDHSEPLSVWSGYRFSHHLPPETLNWRWQGIEHENFCISNMRSITELPNMRAEQKKSPCWIRPASCKCTWETTQQEAKWATHRHCFPPSTNILRHSAHGRRALYNYNG